MGEAASGPLVPAAVLCVAFPALACPFSSEAAEASAAFVAAFVAGGVGEADAMAGCTRSIRDVPAASAETAALAGLLLLLDEANTTGGVVLLLLLATAPGSPAESLCARDGEDDGDAADVGDAAADALTLGLTKALLRAAKRFMPARTASTRASVATTGEEDGAGFAVAVGVSDVAAAAAAAVDVDADEDGALLLSMVKI